MNTNPLTMTEAEIDAFLDERSDWRSWADDEDEDAIRRESADDELAEARAEARAEAAAERAEARAEARGWA